MGKHIDFVSNIHMSTKRDYVARVLEADKAECAAVAKQWGYDYWDGDRKFGYGGYVYDGRWRVVAESLVAHYRLKDGDRILDVGCGKAHLLYEITQVVPGIEVVGIDISEYALRTAKEEVRPYLRLGDARDLPFEDHSFDFVFSLATLHNLNIDQLSGAISEIVRVMKTDRGYVMVESFRNENEKVNLLYWQLTCESFHSPENWEWILRKNNYNGDFGFIFFE